MKIRNNGARSAPANQVLTPFRRMLITVTEPDVAPQPAPIRWTQAARQLSTARRHSRIAMAAYYLAEARGFIPGHDTEDWMAAQSQVDASDAGTFEGW